MKRLMIVDDAAFMRATIKRMLDSHEYEVVAEAPDGSEAVKLYKQYLPDITTMDITMPNMTGIEALKAIKLYDANAKIVMVTSMGQESFIREAIMNGASSFIVKPFQKEKLLEVLDGITK